MKTYHGYIISNGVEIRALLKQEHNNEEITLFSEKLGNDGINVVILGTIRHDNFNYLFIQGECNLNPYQLLSFTDIILNFGKYRDSLILNPAS